MQRLLGRPADVATSEHSGHKWQQALACSTGKITVLCKCSFQGYDKKQTLVQEIRGWFV